MRHTLLAASIACSLVVTFGLPARAGVIKTTDKPALAEAVGTDVVVEGTVASASWSKSGKVCNIEFTGEPNFVVAVFEKSRPKLDEAFGGDFTKQFAGATLRVSGKLAAYGGVVRKYKEATQIVVTQTNQITVMAAATQPATAPSAP